MINNSDAIQLMVPGTGRYGFNNRNIEIVCPARFRDTIRIQLSIYGPKGGFRDYIELNPEQAWLLGDILRELAEKHG